MSLVKLLAAVVVAAAAWELALKQALFGKDDLVPCPNTRLAHLTERPECYFSETYEAARSLFREAAQEVGATLHAFPVQGDLTVDIAVIPGSDSSKTLVHISGTHGVEGFAGSAIQTAFLRELAKKKKKANGNVKLERTLVLVHALNAYGMANWRRFNENNVDLNRNAHWDKESLEKVLNRDPNAAGYEDLNPLLNPARPPSKWDDLRLIVEGIKSIVHLGSFAAVKRGLVTGTYTREKGIFFGGRELQKSHKIVREFLEKQGFAERTTDVIVIDVHTGLGPVGKDTILIDDDVHGYVKALVEKKENILGVSLLPPHAVEVQRVPIGQGSNGAGEGYDAVQGTVHSEYPNLFKNAKKIISTTQEFGTLPAALVARAMIKENQALHYGTDLDRAHAAAVLQYAFWPKKQFFVSYSLHRGVLLLSQAASQ